MAAGPAGFTATGRQGTAAKCAEAWLEPSTVGCFHAFAAGRGRPDRVGIISVYRTPHRTGIRCHYPGANAAAAGWNTGKIY